MQDRSLQIRLGIGALVAAGFLLLVAIPGWVSSPSNVPNIVLSPLFWPNTLAMLTGVIGLGLVLTGGRLPEGGAVEPSDVSDRSAAYGRLAIIAAIMAATILAMPRIGLVWTTMLDFALMALLVRCKQRRTALICAVLVPLFLYGFFAHVAGVAIPQGNYVRLP